MTQDSKPLLAIVDDNTSFCALLESEFENTYQIQIFNSGIAVIEWLENNKPDVIILDIHMPNMNGIETLEKIFAKHKNIPVILHSAYEQHKDNYLTWGATQYVVKSGNLEPLKTAVQQAITQQATTQ